MAASKQQGAAMAQDSSNEPGSGDRLAAERDRAIEFADHEYDIELTLGDSKVSVYYVIGLGNEPAVTCASWGGVVDADCFSARQLADWTDSIRRHLRAEAEEAQAAAADAREYARAA